ncbi:MAG: glycosyltransferase family 39 protein, partial [Candidatus Melainabacteria bacterium]|nr:glycosyltransferase family 39 protein [Candidatus Melainabacteria bacterium]
MRIRKGFAAPWQYQDWYCLALLCLLCVLVFFPGLGEPGILNSSDAYYSEGAREMVESGNFLTPHLNYLPWFEKPILNYWLIAASYSLLGVNEFAARIPSALSGAALVILIFALGRTFLTRRAAFLSSLVLIASPLFLVISRVSLTDGPLTTLMSFAMMALFTVLNGGPNAFLWLGYAVLGLTVLLKGPIGMVLVGGTVVVYLATTARTLPDAAKSILNLKPMWGLTIIALIAAPWFVAEHVATAGAFTREFFIEQNLGRAAGSVTTHHNPDAWWFYLPYVVGGFFPWSLMVFAMSQFMRHIWTRRYAALSSSKLLVFAVSWSCVVL